MRGGSGGWFVSSGCRTKDGPDSSIESLTVSLRAVRDYLSALSIAVVTEWGWTLGVSPTARCSEVAMV